MKLRNIITILAVGILLVGLGYGFYLYTKIFSPNTTFKESKVYVEIPSNSTYQEVTNILKPYIKDFDNFEILANQFGYSEKYIPGRFVFKKDMNSYQIFSTLRKNTPLNVIFNNQETIEKLAGRLSTQIEPDSLTLLQAFTDTDFMSEAGFDKNNILSMFIPNTFEFYWNTTPIKVRNTLHREYIKFWNEERTQKAKKLGLTPIQVSILASIVQKETSKNDEKSKIARVYLNRLNNNILLQADPTVVYAKKLLSKDFDQVIKRVYLNDLNLDSPYNTYKYKGLPPGPISMPDVNTIDAVLNAEPHDYIYFCASVDRIGYHEFAKTIDQHAINRNKYIQWLEKNDIK